MKNNRLDDDDFKSKSKMSEKLKPVDPKDFFGSSAASKPVEKCSKKAEKKRKEEPKVDKKRKVPEEEIHDDEAFSSLLKSIDDEKKVKPSPNKKAKKESPTKLKKPSEKSPPPKSISSPKMAKKKTPEKLKSPEKPKMEAIKSLPQTETPSESLLWVDRYKPTTLKGVIGQQGDKSNMKKLLNWLRNWPKNNLHNGGESYFTILLFSIIRMPFCKTFP